MIFCRAQLYYVFLFCYKIFKDQLTTETADLLNENQDNCFNRIKLCVQKAPLRWKNLLHAALGCLKRLRSRIFQVGKNFIKVLPFLKSKKYLQSYI